VKEEPVMSLAVDALDHLVINVRDVEAAAAWYQRVLGMTREDFDPGPGKVRRTSMKFGRQKINLRPLSASKEEWFTADHETGGLSLLDGNISEGSVLGNFSTNDHTGIAVPVFSYGPGAEMFRGVYQNTEINKKIEKLLSLR